MGVDLSLVRSVLFLPASNPRAIAKARTLNADMVILDLEDAVKPEDKDAARAAAVAAMAEPWPMPVAIRINWYCHPLDGLDRSPPYEPDRADCAAVAASKADLVVAPKGESGFDRLADITGKPILAMIETPYAVLHLRELVTYPQLAGLIVGTNDLASALRLPGRSPRPAMTMALQSVVCAARMVGLPAWDGVFNSLDDRDGFAAECREGRALGFNGKSLIHPNQIDICNRTFAPTDEELDRAERLIAAATGGAERFEGEMIEQMHVEQARRILERARR